MTQLECRLMRSNLSFLKFVLFPSFAQLTPLPLPPLSFSLSLSLSLCRDQVRTLSICVPPFVVAAKLLTPFPFSFLFLIFAFLSLLRNLFRYVLRFELFLLFFPPLSVGAVR